MSSKKIQNKKPKKDKTPKTKAVKNARTKLKLHNFIIILTSIATLAGFIIFGYFTLNVLKQHKVRDTIAMLYYDFSHETTLLLTKLYNLSIEASSRTINLPPEEQKNYIKLEYTPETKKIVVKKGMGRKSIPLEEVGLLKSSLTDKYNFLSIAGHVYVAKKISQVPSADDQKIEIRMWPIDIRPVLKNRYKDSKNKKVYIVTREGKLIYSNSRVITTATFESRQLLKQFINAQLREGQIEVQQPNEGKIYGFFATIPLTNAVLFAESSENIIIDQVLGVLKDLIIVALLILLAVIIATHIGLRNIKIMLDELALFILRFSHGMFNVVPKAKSFGELQLLRDSFVQLGGSLIERDSKIMNLLEKEKEKISMEKEFEIAKSVQQNLLPPKLKGAHTSVDLESIYMPAEKVAGDWYFHYYDDERKTLIFSIVDISGHGAGSALFTAMIASIFALETPNIIDAPNDLFDKINHTIKHFGTGEWHATMQLGILDILGNKLTFYNAGHVSPMMYLKKAEKYQQKAVSLPSNILGLYETTTIATQSYDVSGGLFLCLYSDGLTEQVNPEGKAYGNKALRNCCKKLVDKSTQDAAATLMSEYRNFQQDAKQVDDISVLLIKYK